MAWTQADLDAVEAALASGVTRVTHGTTTTDYQSRADLLALRQQMMAELGLVDQNKVGVRRVRMIIGKGL